MDRILTKRQRELLTKVQAAIRNEPQGYDQQVYGSGTISCETPACIAGHIVASEPELIEELRLQRDGEDPTDRDDIGSTINGIACEALGTPVNRYLFRSDWPIEWLEQIEPGRARVVDSESFKPSADDAVQVIGAILDGRIQSAVISGRGNR